jgi:hypothetical protein
MMTSIETLELLQLLRKSGTANGNFPKENRMTTAQDIMLEYPEFKDLTEHQLFDLINTDEKVRETYDKISTDLFKSRLTEEELNRYKELMKKKFPNSDSKL